MKKMLKGAALGGVIGATIASIQSYKADDPIDDLPSKVLQGGAVGTVSGSFIGMFGDFRARKAKKKKNKATAMAVALAAKPLVTDATKLVSGKRHKHLPPIEQLNKVTESVGKNTHRRNRKVRKRIKRTAHTLSSAAAPKMTQAKELAGVSP